MNENPSREGAVESPQRGDGAPDAACREDGAEWIQSKRLVFLVGVTRSGTSLLYALANQHPDVSLMYEADAAYLDRNFFTPYDLDRLEFWNGVLDRHGLLPGDLKAVKDPRSLFAAHAAVKGASVCGEKAPSYCAHLPRLARDFPDARFLVIQRPMAEIYRSTVDAARHTRWFARPGTFYRLLREQELLVRDLQQLRAEGVPVHCVSYADLVAKTEPVMRGVCNFLEIDFSPHVVSLNGSDLTALYQSPEHDHLRSREILLRQNPAVLPEHRARCIARFQMRWDRLLSEPGSRRASEQEAGPFEVAWRQALGRFVVGNHYLTRLLYELCPLPALNAYRHLKREFAELAQLFQLTGELRRQTIRRLVSLHIVVALLTAVVAVADAITGAMSLAPFYLLPVLLAVRRLNGAAGIFVALFCAGFWTLAHDFGERGSLALATWNFGMRFVLFAIFALLAAGAPAMRAGSASAGES